MSELRTYRHEKTGLIGRYDPRVALAHPHLIEVEDDAKPFALMPIPREVADAHRAKAKNQSDEEAPLDEKEED